MTLFDRTIAIFIWFCFITAASPLSAEVGSTHTFSNKPLWEMGILANLASIPLYRGSGDDKLYALPLPYLIYRGRFIQSDRDGVRGIFYASDHFEITLSGWGNPPVDDDETAREGMGDLDALGELGPALRWYPFKRRADRRLYLQTTARTIFSVGLPDDLRIHHRGYRLAAAFYYRDETPPAGHHPMWKWGVSLGIDFTDSQYNDYIYGVPDQYANAVRPAYHAGNGYAGAMAAAYLIRKLSDTLSFAIYTRIDNISGVVYETSPLVETSNNVLMGASFIWKLKESQRPAPAVK